MQNDLETVMILIEKGASKNLTVRNVLPIELAIKKRASFANNLESQGNFITKYIHNK